MDEIRINRNLSVYNVFDVTFAAQRFKEKCFISHKECRKYLVFIFVSLEGEGNTQNAFFAHGASH